jgi:mitotic spindle assembly checkpoint protein MAD2B
LFQRRRKYNVPVHICAHPELNKYIRRVVDDVKPMLEANQVDHIAIVIKNKENIPVERFVFKTQKGTANDICSKRFSETLERDLRTLLLKLSGSDSLLSDNPPDSTFSVEVCTSDTAAASATVAMEQGHQVSYNLSPAEIYTDCAVCHQNSNHYSFTTSYFELAK